MKKHLDEFDLNLHERKIHSQNGEDGIIEFIFSKIGTTNKFSVEFGVGNGFESNTTYLLEKKGWKGLMMDYGSDEKIKTENLIKKGLYYRKFGIKYCLQKGIKFLKKTMDQYKRSRYFQYDIKKEKVTAENIEKLFQKYNVPKNFDLLSIDIDFNDYWVWKTITNYHPNVVIIEYNSSLPPTESKVVPYDSEAVWDGTNYFGASLLALQNLGNVKGYTLLGCDSKGVNAFFCKKELIDGIKIKDIQYLYKPPKYGKMINGIHIGHPTSDKKMIKI